MAVVALVAVLVASGCGGSTAENSSGSTPVAGPSGRGGMGGGGRFQRPDLKPTTVKVATVGTGTIPRVLRTSGRLKARSHVAITAGVAAQLVAVHVREGDEVHAGQVLATFEVETFDYDLRDAQITLDQAKQEKERAQLALQKTVRDLERAQQTVEGGHYDERIFSREAVENLEHAVALARVELELATQRVERADVTVLRAQKARTECEVRTPIRGVVVRRQAEPFDRVLRGAELFQVSDPYALEIDVELTEAEAADVLAGQPVLIAARGRASFVYPGTVERVAPVVNVERGLVGVKIRVSPWRAMQAINLWGQTQQVMRLAGGPVAGIAPMFPFAGSGSSPDLRPGMFVGIEIATAVHQNAVLCPKAALLFERDQPYVFVVNEKNIAVQVPVSLRTDFATQEAIEVDSGLKVGDRVVVEQADLKSNSPVTISD